MCHQHQRVINSLNLHVSYQGAIFLFEGKLEDELDNLWK